MKQIFIILAIFACIVGMISVALKQASSLFDGESILGITVGGNSDEAQPQKRFEFLVSKNKGDSFMATKHIESQSVFNHHVRDIEYVVDTYGNTILLVATDRGIFTSLDQGTHWAHVFSKDIAEAKDITIDDTTQVFSVAVAGTNTSGDSVIFVSRSGGATFTESFVAVSSSDPVMSVVYDTYNNQHMYAITKDGLFLTSIDGGASWYSQKARGLSGTVHTMVSHSNNTTENSILFVITDDGLYRSTTKGESWESLNNGLLRYEGATVVHAIHTSKTFNALYIGTNYGLLVSNNRGISFEPVSFLVPYGTEPVTTVALHPRNSNTVYAGIGNKLYVTENAGKSWYVHTVSGTQSTKMETVFINPFNTRTILVVLSRTV